MKKLKAICYVKLWKKGESENKSYKVKDKQRRKSRTFNYLNSLLQIYM